MTVVDLYTIQILYGDGEPATRPTGALELNIKTSIAEAEENLTDLLPHGYRARIRRWNDPTGEPTQEDDDE